MKNVLDALFFGKLSSWERKPVRTAKEIELRQKWKDEQRYFAETLSAEDYKRLEALENLHSQMSAADEFNTFCYAFKLGVSLMCAVFADDVATPQGR
jgi:hypothetical protein